MARLTYLERNYEGPTLYVETNRGRQYTCYPVKWVEQEDGQLKVTVESFPRKMRQGDSLGNSHYKGTVLLSVIEKEKFIRITSRPGAAQL